MNLLLTHDNRYAMPAAQETATEPHSQKNATQQLKMPNCYIPQSLILKLQNLVTREPPKIRSFASSKKIHNKKGGVPNKDAHIDNGEWRVGCYFLPKVEEEPLKL